MYGSCFFRVLYMRTNFPLIKRKGIASNEVSVVCRLLAMELKVIQIHVLVIVIVGVIFICLCITIRNDITTLAFNFFHSESRYESRNQRVQPSMVVGFPGILTFFPKLLTVNKNEICSGVFKVVLVMPNTETLKTLSNDQWKLIWKKRQHWTEQLRSEADGKMCHFNSSSRCYSFSVGQG